MVGEDQRTAEVALVLRRLLLEDVAREGMASLHLALRRRLEALLRAAVGLHLRHDVRRGRIAAQVPRAGIRWLLHAPVPPAGGCCQRAARARASRLPHSL